MDISCFLPSETGEWLWNKVMCEKELLLAIVERAYDDAHGLTTFKLNREKATASAWDWFFSDAYDPCSFLWICDRLNLPCLKIREKIKEDIHMKKMNPFAVPPKPMMKQKGTPLAGFAPDVPPVPKKRRRMPKPQGMPMGMNEMM